MLFPDVVSLLDSLDGVLFISLLLFPDAVSPPDSLKGVLFVPL